MLLGFNGLVDCRRPLLKDHTAVSTPEKLMIHFVFVDTLKENDSL